MQAENARWLDIAPIGREFGSEDYERLARQAKYKRQTSH